MDSFFLSFDQPLIIVKGTGVQLGYRKSCTCRSFISEVTLDRIINHNCSSWFIHSMR